jgi:hypothetical protein
MLVLPAHRCGYGRRRGGWLRLVFGRAEHSLVRRCRAVLLLVSLCGR